MVWAFEARYAIRSLRSNPAFVLPAVLCLALGIGVNTTVFSVFNGLLLKPLPFAHPERTVLLGEIHQASPDFRLVSYPNFRDWQEQGNDIAEMASIRPLRLTVSDTRHSERLAGASISWNLFAVLGIKPIVGRDLRVEDEAGNDPVVLLSESVWQADYGRDARVVGRTLIVEGEAHTVIGVMPQLRHPVIPGALRAARLWLPLGPAERRGAQRDRRDLLVFAKLAAGVERDGARARLNLIARALEGLHAENLGWAIAVRPLDAIVSPTTRALLVLMMGAVGLFLLIACANVANLMLARAVTRDREVAIRTALGATRGRIALQLLTESMMTAGLSAPIGIVLAYCGIALLLRAASGNSESLSLEIDWRVLLFTIVLSAITSLLFGLAPMLYALNGTRYQALAAGGFSSSANLAQRRLRNTLVAAEVASSLVLLVGASLFVRSFANLLNSEHTVDVSSLLTLRYELPEKRYVTPEAIARQVEVITAAISALPGVESAAASGLQPLRGGGERSAVVTGGSGTEPVDQRSILYAGVTADFFETLNVPILVGRSFSETEANSPSPVVVINRRMAEWLWPKQSAVGERFRIADDPEKRAFTVIGVSQDVVTWDLSDRPLPTAYLPFMHAPVREPHALIRAAGNPQQIAAAARAAIHAGDPTVAVFEIQTMEQVYRQAFWRQELLGKLFGVFGALALVLTVLGVYGVLSFAVSQRTREIGVRMALGAQRVNVVRMIVSEGMALLAGGIAVGIVGSVSLTRLIQGRLYEVSATDPTTLVGVALLVACAGLVASYVPARRAASVPPIMSMRE